MTLPKLGTILPAPLLVGLAAVGFLYAMARADGAKDARIEALERHSDSLAQATIQAAKTRRAVQAQSEATDRENARLRAVVAQREASIARLRRLADSAGAALVPVLAGLPDSVAFHVKQVLALKDSTITLQSAQIDDLTRGLGRMEEDRNRWREQSGRDAQLATQWETQAGQWRKESRRGCLPLLGCVSRTAVALLAGGLGVAGGIALSR